MPSSDPPALRLHVLPGLDELDEPAVEEEAARATSGELWRVLCAGTTYEGLTDALRREYNGQLERAVADIDAFLAALHERGLRAT